MIVKVHEIDHRVIIAVCDDEHLGKTFEDGNLEFKVSESFFGGDPVNEEELIKMMKGADTINAFGNKSTSILEKEGLISENSVIIIAGIKHAQVYRV